MRNFGWLWLLSLVQNGLSETAFTEKERFEILMEATGGGKVIPTFDVNDFGEMIAKPQAAKEMLKFLTSNYYLSEHKISN